MLRVTRYSTPLRGRFCACMSLGLGDAKCGCRVWGIFPICSHARRRHTSIYSFSGAEDPAALKHNIRVTVCMAYVQLHTTHPYCCFFASRTCLMRIPSAWRKKWNPEISPYMTTFTSLLHMLCKPRQTTSSAYRQKKRILKKTTKKVCLTVHSPVWAGLT